MADPTSLRFTPPPSAPGDATDVTRQRNAAAAAALPLDDPTDLALASRGRLAPLPTDPVMGSGGWAVWDVGAFARTDPTLGDDPPAPDTVHPSLWRQAGLNAVGGLFEVCDGVWQVRGLDISNLTVIAGETGWIVVDTLSCADTASAAMRLVNDHLGERPVTAVIITHSHLDHFGGITGVVDPDRVASGEVPVLAPAGFLAAAASENVIAGNVMGRRATYMYGMLLPRDARGHVDSGLGRGIPVLAAAGLLAPTHEVTHTGETHVLDGVEVEFHLTPGTEAPAEMNFLFGPQQALCMAENCTHTLHNVYTLRGTVVRDALAWSTYIDEALERFGGRADVAFSTHHWPRWGSGPNGWEAWLGAQRDAYRYLHDQTMRLANHGYSADEIAEEVRLPDTLARCFHVRDYYGTVKHNTRAVYQRYLGFYDNNPATLDPHPRTERARRYVAAMGGAEATLEVARQAFTEGDYRWVAEVVNHVVFADPANTDARLLQASALEQLGYASESGPWRDNYLTAAQELRNGSPTARVGERTNPAMVAAMTPLMLLTWLGVRVDGPAAAAAGDLDLTLVVTDRPDDGTWHVGLSNGTLRATPGRAAPDPDATVSCTRDALAELVRQPTADVLASLEQAGSLAIEGERNALDQLLDVCDTFEVLFPLIEPRSES